MTALVVIEPSVVVESLSDTQWRVGDNRWPEHDARSLLGFVEKKNDLFEVMQCDHGFQWFTFDSLAQAIAHFTSMGLTTVPDDEHVLLRLRVPVS